MSVAQTAILLLPSIPLLSYAILPAMDAEQSLSSCTVDMAFLLTNRNGSRCRQLSDLPICVLLTLD